MQGFNDGEFLNRFLHIFTAADTGGINQSVGLVKTLIGDIDAVAGGAGLVIHHHPLFTQHAIHQRRFAHVRAPDHRNTGTFARFPTVKLFRLGKFPEHDFHQTADTTVVGRSNMVKLSHAHTMEFNGGHIGVQTVGFIGHQITGFINFPQVLGNHLVSGGQTGLGIHQKQYRIGLINCLQ